jgi:hypothetical protein
VLTPGRGCERNFFILQETGVKPRSAEVVGTQLHRHLGPLDDSGAVCLVPCGLGCGLRSQGHCANISLLVLVAHSIFSPRGTENGVYQLSTTWYIVSCDGNLQMHLNLPSDLRWVRIVCKSPSPKKLELATHERRNIFIDRTNFFFF